MTRDSWTLDSMVPGRLNRRQVLRGLALGASLPIVGGILAACGGDDEDEPTPTQASASTATSGTAGAPTATTAVSAGASPTTGSASTPAGTSSTQAGTPKQGGTLTMSYATVVADTLNQHTSNHTQSRMIARHVLDCLTYIDPSNGEVIPWLADSWEISSDGLTYTLKLRSGVKFHDGTDFNAEAVKKNFDYTTDPNTKHAFAYGALGGAKLDRTEVVDPSTARVVFNQPHGIFLTFLSDGGAGIDSPTALEKGGQDYGITSLVGSGPFTFVEWVQKDHVTLKKNPDYKWGPKVAGHQDAAYVDTIVWREIAENATRAAALQNGDIDMALLVESQAAQFQGSRDVAIELIPKPGTTRMYTFNMKRPGLDDIRVRQAINHAIDKAALIKLPAWAGIGRPGVAPLPSNMVPNGDLSSLKPFDYPFDVAKANQLLDQAGWTKGANGMRAKDGKELVLELVTTSAAVPTAEPFAGMLQQVGIKVNIDAGDFNYYIDKTNKGEYDITLRSDSGYNSAGMIEEYFHSKGVYNTGGMETLADSAAIDQAIDTALTTPDNAARWTALFKAMELAMKNAVAVMGWEIDYVFGVRNTVKNPQYNEVGYPYFYDTWVEK